MNINQIKKTRKEIQNLEEFKDKKTFKLLYDRTTYIEELINQIPAIRQLPVEVLSTHGVDVMGLIRVHTELVFVLYRSMFQRSVWESNLDEKIKNINTNAYSYDKKDIELHHDIVEHVNRVLAHQDNVESSEKNMRGVYPPIEDENGNQHTLTWNFIGHHACALSPLINLMKEAIRTAYFNKFKEHLPPLMVKAKGLPYIKIE